MLRTSTALALLLATPAFAGGVAPQSAPAPVALPQAAQDWTGFDGGGQFDGLATLESENDQFSFIAEYDGTLAGLFAGYRSDLGNAVVGAEIGYVVGSVERGRIGSGVAFVVGTEEPDTRLLRAGGEVDYDLGDLLVYGTAGLAHIEIDFDDIIPTLDSNGYFFGLGVDYRVAENIVVGAELLQDRFEDFDAPQNPV